MTSPGPHTHSKGRAEAGRLHTHTRRVLRHAMTRYRRTLSPLTVASVAATRPDQSQERLLADTAANACDHAIPISNPRALDMHAHTHTLSLSRTNAPRQTLRRAYGTAPQSQTRRCQTKAIPKHTNRETAVARTIPNAEREIRCHHTIGTHTHTHQEPWPFFSGVSAKIVKRFIGTFMGTFTCGWKHVHTPLPVRRRQHLHARQRVGDQECTPPTSCPIACASACSLG